MTRSVSGGGKAMLTRDACSASGGIPRMLC